MKARLPRRAVRCNLPLLCCLRRFGGRGRPPDLQERQLDPAGSRSDDPARRAGLRIGSVEGRELRHPRSTRSACARRSSGDRLDAEYTETTIAYADGRGMPVRLAKPVVISQPRPECVAPAKRSWHEQEPVTEVDPIEN